MTEAEDELPRGQARKAEGHLAMSYEKDLEQFLAERNQAFIALDIQWARRMAPGLTSDEAAILALHKARYECKQIPDDLRQDSRRFLIAAGSTRLGDLPWPPEGELPT